MADDGEMEMIRKIAILVIVRLLQLLSGIAALIGIGLGKYPETVLAILFALCLGNGPKIGKE